MKRILLIILTLSPLAAFAQLPIPTIDVALKGQYNGELKNYITASVRGEINVHINQFVAVGGFYTRSVWGSNTRVEPIDEDFNIEELTLGARIQASTGRISKFRPYVFFTFTKIESVQEVSSSTRFAEDWSGITFGGGLMLKAGNRLYINLIEVEAIPLANEPFFFIDSTKDFLAVRIGANYTIGKTR